MNVLILSGKFGFGHMSTAYSIESKIISENIDNNVCVMDLLEYLFPTLNKVIYSMFNFLVGRCSHLYNFLNRHASKCASAPLKSVMVKRIDKLLKDKNVDLVISTLPICSQYISAYKRMTGNNITLYTVITDISVHKEWLSSGTSKYFVPSVETKEYLISLGISSDNIYVSGIPVRNQFCNQYCEKKEILIMGGGLGLIPGIEDFLSELDENNNITVNVILGNNRKLYNKLVNRYNNINIIGFTDRVYDYMNRASLIVTKAGGITMSEAIRSETPILCLKPFLEQEVGNAKYIECKSIGRVLLNNKYLIYNCIVEMLESEELEMMKKNMKKIKSSFDNISFTGEMI